MDAALLAVEVYNKPRTTFRSQNFIVLMIIAWTRLFHAYFYKTIGNKYYYKRKGRYEIVDGERKAWELDTCINKYGNLGESVAANLRFFIGLRNRIEHRTTLTSETDTAIFGECQSLLYNYESAIQDFFGPDYALHESLVFALQFSHLRKPQQELANKSAVLRDVRDILDYVSTYRAALSEGVFNSQQFSVKLICVPRISNTNRQDLAVEFVRWSELSEKDKEDYEKLNVIIKDRIVEKERVIEKEMPTTIRVVDSAPTGEGNLQVLVRATNDPSKALATVIYETLSPNLFDDVNKILQANALLSGDSENFKFDQTIYYRVYAGRDNLQAPDKTNEMLAMTGLQLYAPCLHWLTLLSDEAFAKTLNTFVATPKFPSIRAALAISVLLGDEACTWMERKLETTRNRDRFTMSEKVTTSFRMMRQLREEDDCRLAAIQRRRSSDIVFPDKSRMRITQLLADLPAAITSLTASCEKVSRGSKAYHTPCRLLDVLVYGSQIQKRGYKVVKFLR